MTSFCQNCAQPREIDDQTGRCLTCGRIPLTETAPPPAIDRSRFARPSPSGQYRDSVVTSNVLATSAAYQSASNIAPSATGFPKGTVRISLGQTLVTQGECEDDEVVDDEIDDEPEPSALFGSPTVKRFCECGAILVWLASGPPPVACFWCGFSPPHV